MNNGSKNHIRSSASSTYTTLFPSNLTNLSLQQSPKLCNKLLYNYIHITFRNDTGARMFVYLYNLSVKSKLFICEFSGVEISKQRRNCKLMDFFFIQETWTSGEARNPNTIIECDGGTAHCKQATHRYRHCYYNSVSVCDRL